MPIGVLFAAAPDEPSGRFSWSSPAGVHDVLIEAHGLDATQFRVSVVAGMTTRLLVRLLERDALYRSHDYPGVAVDFDGNVRQDLDAEGRPLREYDEAGELIREFDRDGHARWRVRAWARGEPLLAYTHRPDAPPLTLEVATSRACERGVELTTRIRNHGGQPITGLRAFAMRRGSNTFTPELLDPALTADAMARHCLGGSCALVPVTTVAPGAAHDLTLTIPYTSVGHSCFVLVYEPAGRVFAYAYATVDAIGDRASGEA